MAALVGLVLLGAVQVSDAGGGEYIAPEPEAVVPDAIDRRLGCIAWHESRNYPLAFNRVSGASGLLQFLPSTWRTTPQGRAGMSIWDAAAQWAAGRWMISVGRVGEWVPVQRGLC